MLASTLYHLIYLLSFFIMKSHAQIPIRLITHNIRYATTSPFIGEKPWADRKQLILNELYYNTLYNAESFICLQEVLHQQLVDVMTGLNKTEEWSYIGVGRDDGKQKGEYSPVIYRPKVWKLESWRTVWLSETPDRPGKGWDAASVRIVTVGTFQHKASKQRVVTMSTHLDDQGEVSRRESAKLILKVIDQVTCIDSSGNSTPPGACAARLPVLLAGDLNSPPDGSAYKILNAATSAVQDLEELAEWSYGDQSTFTGFDDKSRTKIDHLFAGPRDSGRWRVKGYSVLPNRFEDGVYNSDHRAVVGDLVLAL